jgi:hypothetical protein
MTAGGSIVYLARAGPDKNAVTILSRQNFLEMARGHNRHILKYLC